MSDEQSARLTRSVDAAAELMLKMDAAGQRIDLELMLDAILQENPRVPPLSREDAAGELIQALTRALERATLSIKARIRKLSR